ncbi:radical SAM protein, partial [bacterium]|nr:radical SAM protein [candidate division CSSED10-310 bacterium]
FCANSVWKGYYGSGYFRFRPLHQVHAELLTARRRYRVRRILFMDDVFTINRSYLEGLLPWLRRQVGAAYEIGTHPAAFDARTARLLKNTGCDLVSFGVQTYDETLRRDRLHRPESNRIIDHALRCCEQAGLPYKVDILFDFDGDSPAAQEETVLRLAGRKPFRINQFFYTHFPGTRMLQRCLIQGKISGERLEAIEEGREDSYFAFDMDDHDRRLHYRGIVNLLKIKPLFAGSTVRKLVSTRWYTALALVPKPLMLIPELLVALLHRHSLLLIELQHYWNRIRQRAVELAQFLLPALARILTRLLNKQPVPPRIPASHGETCREQRSHRVTGTQSCLSK